MLSQSSRVMRWRPISHGCQVDLFNCMKQQMHSRHYLMTENNSLYSLPTSFAIRNLFSRLTNIYKLLMSHDYCQGYSEGYFPLDRLTIWSFSNAASKQRLRETENSLFIRFRVKFEYFPSLLQDSWKYFETLHKSRFSFFPSEAINCANNTMPSEMIQDEKTHFSL